MTSLDELPSETTEIAAETWLRTFNVPVDLPWNAAILCNADWAHPAWSQYILVCYDLTTETETPPVKYRDDVTHELLVYAVNPRVKLTPDTPLWGGILSPPNHGYQFTAASNDKALERLVALGSGIAHRSFSPDTDWRHYWDKELFPDAVTMSQGVLTMLQAESATTH